MPDKFSVVDGEDSFTLGMDSYTSPNRLVQGEYVSAMNIITRGGLAQTRPGSVSVLDLPDGNLQGSTLFTPSSGIPHLVFAVEGKIYVSPSPFNKYYQLPDLQFSKSSQYIAWASCVQSTYYSPSGILLNLDQPISVLVIQDGVTRAAFWDGSIARHLNPTRSTAAFTQEGLDETPVGLWMVWSNNRLWVSRGSQVFASDIGDPLKFTETQYLNEFRAFYLPGPCTGMAETSDRQGIICFTATAGVFIQSSIQTRTQWVSTKDFQQTVLPDVGCIAPRSIVLQYGLLWWYSPKGLINQNDALRLNLTSRLDVQDNEMFQSKSNLSSDLSMVCGAFIENFLFHGVPNGDKLNTRVHVLDQAPFEGNVNAWPSYWTGWRPVEFARGIVGSKERVFCASKDYDGKNRIWELFRGDKTDNGIPITSWLVTRRHFFGNREPKKFRYAEIELDNIKGPTAFMVAAGCMRGAPQVVMTKDINATVGQVYADQVYGGTNKFAGSRPQSRIVLTTEKSDTSTCNDKCVESESSGLIDKALYLVIAWSGIAGISAYRIFATQIDRDDSGGCEEDETGQNKLLTPQGCGELSLFSTKSPFSEYYSKVSFTRKSPITGLTSTWTSTQSSFINQADATRKATKTAEWHVLKAIGEVV